MAGYSTGVTVTWRGTAIGEATDIKAMYGGNLPVSRSSRFSPEAGTVEIASLSTASHTVGNDYGRKGSLSFSGGGVSFSMKAVLLSFDLTAKVNDVWRLKSVFRIVQE